MNKVEALSLHRRGKAATVAVLSAAMALGAVSPALAKKTSGGAVYKPDTGGAVYKPETRKLNKQAHGQATQLGGRILNLYRQARRSGEKERTLTENVYTNDPRTKRISVEFDSGRSRVAYSSGKYVLQAEGHIGKDHKMHPETLTKVYIEEGAGKFDSAYPFGLANMYLEKTGKRSWVFAGIYETRGPKEKFAIGTTEPSKFHMSGQELQAAGSQMNHIITMAVTGQPTYLLEPPFQTPESRFLLP